MELPRHMVESSAPSLEILFLEQLDSLENLPVVIDCLAKSARLKELIITGVPKFMATGSVESRAFGSLSKLEIDVKEWSMKSSAAIEETMDGMLQGCCNSLIRLRLTGVPNWEWLPGSIQHLTALSKLEIQNFGIEELPQWFENLSSLSQLSLSSCKKLRLLPTADALKRLTNLRRLDIEDCPLLSIDLERVDSTPHLTIKVDDDHLTNESIPSCSVEITDGGMPSAAVKVLFQNLINSFEEVYTLRLRLNKDAQKLQKTLPILQSYLNDAVTIPHRTHKQLWVGI